MQPFAVRTTTLAVLPYACVHSLIFCLVSGTVDNYIVNLYITATGIVGKLNRNSTGARGCVVLIAGGQGPGCYRVAVCFKLNRFTA